MKTIKSILITVAVAVLLLGAVYSASSQNADQYGAGDGNANMTQGNLTDRMMTLDNKIAALKSNMVMTLHDLNQADQNITATDVRSAGPELNRTEALVQDASEKLDQYRSQINDIEGSLQALSDEIQPADGAPEQELTHQESINWLYYSLSNVKQLENSLQYEINSIQRKINQNTE